MRQVRRKLERCGDCTPAARCANHQACATQRDAALAAEIGEAWAVFVRGQVDVRKPWPPFSGRAAAIASRLVTGLADEPCRSQLALIDVTLLLRRPQVIGGRDSRNPSAVSSKHRKPYDSASRSAF
jgi:hypothetical protein